MPAASVRPATPSLPRMFETCTPAVLSLMNSNSAIWRFVRPAATRARTSSSRAGQPERVGRLGRVGGAGSGVDVASSGGASSIRARVASD